MVEAEAYDKNSVVQREVGMKLMKRLAPEKGDKILDIGCGTGYLTKALADLVGPEGKVSTTNGCYHWNSCVQIITTATTGWRLTKMQVS